MSKYLEKLDDALDTVFTGSPKTDKVFNCLEIVTHLEKLKIAKFFLVIISIYMIFGAFAELICNGVGFIYPAICSLDALETHQPEDDTKWLIYWVVFATFSLIEFFSDKIFHVFPVYYLAKLIFLIWCFWPTAENGSMRIYKKIIRPYYLKKRDSIISKPEDPEPDPSERTQGSPTRGSISSMGKED